MAPSVEVNRFACVSVKPNCFPAALDHDSILDALSPKVTSTTFWTSARSEAAETDAFPMSRSIFPIPAAAIPLATPFRNLLKESPMLSVDSSTASSHFRLSFSISFVMSRILDFMLLSFATTSNSTLPSAIFPSYNSQKAREDFFNVLIVLLALFIIRQAQGHVRFRFH